MNTIIAMRKMIVNNIPVVNVGLRSDSSTNSSTYSAVIFEALTRDFGDFVNVYNKFAYFDKYKLEDVIDRVLKESMISIAEYSGIDVVYSDKTIHIRFILTGYDVAEIKGVVFNTNKFSTHYMNNRAFVEFSASRVDDKEEYWNYYINIESK